VQTLRKEDASIGTSPRPAAGPVWTGAAGRGQHARNLGMRLLSLRDWRVRSKLTAVLVIPAVAFLVLGSFGIRSSLRNADEFDRGSKLAGFGGEVTKLVHELQSERDLSAGFIQTGDKAAQQRDLVPQQRRADQTASGYRAAEAPLYEDLGARLQGKFDAVRVGLNDLNGLREAVSSGSLTERASFDEYSKIIAVLLDVDLEIAQAGGDEALAQNVRAFNSLSRTKEVTAQVRGTLLVIADRDSFTFGEFQNFADLLARQRAALDQFQADANERQRALFANAVKGQAVLTVVRIQQAALNRQSAASLDIDPQQWFSASTTQIQLLRNVESQLLDAVVEQSRQLSSSAQRQSVRDALLIAVILAVALLALLVVARSMARPLQRLRAGALDIAGNRLPDAVQRLRTSESGDLVIDAKPIGIRSRDEIGQVAQAVDAIQQVALRVASEQAALRRSIGDMFTNLARRSQTLIDRQLELIEDLERNETDPETLEHLFRLDHLATRMRRNAEDLIVLSGADEGRHWAQPMTLVDVVRSAAAEVEEYQRVELLPLADLDVRGQASVNVIHLLAELIENATAFSPPNTKVQIAGQAVPQGYVIEIEDRGLGMTDDELIKANERLADPPEIDFALSRVLGLYVVGRLAQRHGIKVQLRHSWYGGVTALALLPHSLLIWPNAQQTMPESSAAQGRAELPPPDRSAPPSAAPLAPAPPSVSAGPAPASDGAADLPIFEAARSDWFAAEPKMPYRPPRHATHASQASHVHPDAATDGGATPSSAMPTPLPTRSWVTDGPAPSAARPSAPADATPPPFRPAAFPATPPPPDPGQAPPDPGQAPGGTAPARHPDQAGTPPSPPETAPGPRLTQAGTPPSPPETAPGPRLTQAGLPRRAPRTNLAPGIAATDRPVEPSQASPRSPEEVRTMLSSYRSGLERGRLVAGDPSSGPDPQDTP